MARVGEAVEAAGAAEANREHRPRVGGGGEDCDIQLSILLYTYTPSLVNILYKIVIDTNFTSELQLYHLTLGQYYSYYHCSCFTFRIFIFYKYI